MTERMPTVFIGHGSPMNTLEHNEWTDAWREFGETIPTPRAIVAISAHWYIHATAVTMMDRPRTIHDFYGFPDELFAFDYPAPGSAEIAHEVIEAVKPIWVGEDRDTWGLDHGCWSVLAHLWPAADVPVLQVSVDATKPSTYHFDVGAALAPLRDAGVLIIGSGNVVHNLGAMVRTPGAAPFDWTSRFDESVRQVMVDDPASVLSLDDHPDLAIAHPSLDHLLPLHYVAGAAAASGQCAEPLTDGLLAGSLSMASYVVHP